MLGDKALLEDACVDVHRDSTTPDKFSHKILPVHARVANEESQTILASQDQTDDLQLSDPLLSAQAITPGSS